MSRLLKAVSIGILELMFRSSHFHYWFLVTFGNGSYENTKILRNLCLHFARQDGQDRKTQKENHATKVTKIQGV